MNPNVAEKPVLILLVGLPRSGKTTWARAQEAPVVSPDAIRLELHGTAFDAAREPEVWAAARRLVEKLFEAGERVVVLDACSIDRKRRAEWKDPRWSLSFRSFFTSPEDCRLRAVRDGRADLVPVIDRMAARWEPVCPAEWGLA